MRRAARQQLAQGIGYVGQERLRQPARRRSTDRVAVQAGLVSGDQPLLAADPHLDRPPLAPQPLDQRVGVDAREHALGDLAARQVAEPAQHVVQAVAVGRPRHLRAALQVLLHARERVRVDQLAQLLLPEQLAQQVAVERQRGRAPLGRRRVALVHVGRDVVEQQRGRKRRGDWRLDLHQRDLARLQRLQDLDQPGRSSTSLQALAVGLEDDREVLVAARDLEQALRLQPLLPQRRAPARVGARDQQRASGVLAKARPEQRRAAELGDDRRLDLLAARSSTARPPTAATRPPRRRGRAGA